MSATNVNFVSLAEKNSKSKIKLPNNTFVTSTVVCKINNAFIETESLSRHKNQMKHLIFRFILNTLFVWTHFVLLWVATNKPNET